MSIRSLPFRLPRKVRLHPAKNNFKLTKQENAFAAYTQTQTESVYGVLRNQTELAVEEVRVDMAGMKVESKPVELVTSVGSCVAICIHDPTNRCGGLAHIMLPDSAISPQELLPPKFANTAVPALVHALKRVGANENRLTAKIAGGANMFPSLKNNTLNIGQRNVEAVKERLAAHKIRLLAEDVGGACGRRISFNVATNTVIVRCFKGDEKRL